MMGDLSGVYAGAGKVSPVYRFRFRPNTKAAAFLVTLRQASTGEHFELGLVKSINDFNLPGLSGGRRAPPRNVILIMNPL